MTNQPTPQRDVFTLAMTQRAANERAPELLHLFDFDTCSAAIQNASACERKHPSRNIEVWLNRHTILWKTNNHEAPPSDRWSGPEGVGTYELHFADESAWTPIYRRTTPTSRNTA